MLILAAAPLGNVQDASAHLRESILTAKFVAAEDSRRFSRLCKDLGITHSAKVISFFEGNEIERIDELMAILETGNDLLVITDAGMPGISDPGYRLIRAAIERNIPLRVLPSKSIRFSILRIARSFRCEILVNSSAISGTTSN
jgi:16S rRNA (cytidine1402-2'-O)-methyltransferase